MTSKNPGVGTVTIRLLIVGLLVLILLIPTAMISALVNERKNYKEGAIAEVTGKWAGAQTIGGPVVTIPYERRWKDAEGKPQSAVDYVQLLPEMLRAEVELTPETRYRGIYKVILYNARISLRGRFSSPDLDGLGVPAADTHWGEAFASLCIPDMRGIKESLALTWNGRPYPFTPGIREGNRLFASGVSTRVPVDTLQAAAGGCEFSCVLNLNGSEEFSLLPLGRTTEVAMRSAWGDPSFDGAFLPERRRVDDSGFTASWKVLDLNRNYPQQWLGEIDRADVLGSKFGVRLFSPVDEYTTTTRAVKYVIMFVGLTFLIFFMVEIMSRRRIHPVQYLLVGLALCLFYVLLLSISEHLGFVLAYLIASISIIGLITSYVATALGGRVTALVTAGTLAVLYGFLYVLLQNQDYALLIGSIGLFVILAAVMFLSRKVDWYSVDAKREAEPGEVPGEAGVVAETS